MATEKKHRYLAWTIFCTLAGSLVIAAGAVTCPVNHYLTGLYQVAAAVALYLCVVFFMADRNWLDIRAVFTGIWIATTGCAALRLTDYQKLWETKTWLLMAAAYAAFQLGATWGIRSGRAVYPVLHDKAKKLRIGKIRLALRENRLFAICVVTTLLGFACFAANVAVRGFIPCFSDSPTAYMDFYTKFHVFAVAATSASGLCYYCLRTQKLSPGKKLVLVLCMFYLVILFPILVVSRGTFLTAAVSLTVCVFYLHRKKLTALILCVVMIVGVYFLTSSLRGYTDAQLNEIFEPAEISMSQEENTPTVPTAETAPAQTVEPGEVVEDKPATFTLPPKAVFIYSYLTVSHDNFNEAVRNVEDYTYGTRQLRPINVVLRSQWLTEQNDNSKYFFVRPHLNTINLIGDFYYDFGTWGVIICMLVWAFVFGLMQSFCDVGKGPFALLVLGNAMVPVAMSFFSNWLSIFSQWMLWGIVLIYAAAACLTRKEPEESENE